MHLRHFVRSCGPLIIHLSRPPLVARWAHWRGGHPLRRRKGISSQLTRRQGWCDECVRLAGLRPDSERTVHCQLSTVHYWLLSIRPGRSGGSVAVAAAGLPAGLRRLPPTPAARPKHSHPLAPAQGRACLRGYAAGVPTHASAPVVRARGRGAAGGPRSLRVPSGQAGASDGGPVMTEWGIHSGTVTGGDHPRPGFTPLATYLPSPSATHVRCRTNRNRPPCRHRPQNSKRSKIRTSP